MVQVQKAKGIYLLHKFAAFLIILVVPYILYDAKFKDHNKNSVSSTIFAQTCLLLLVINVTKCLLQ